MIYVSVELDNGETAEYHEAKDLYIDNTNSGTSLLIIKIDKERTAYYNLNSVVSFYQAKLITV